MKIYCNFCGKRKLLRDKPSTRFCSKICNEKFNKAVKVCHRRNRFNNKKGEKLR